MKKLGIGRGKSPGLGTQIYRFSLGLWVSQSLTFPKTLCLTSTEGLAEVGKDLGDCWRSWAEDASAAGVTGREKLGLQEATALTKYTAASICYIACCLAFPILYDLETDFSQRLKGEANPPHVA